MWGYAVAMIAAPLTASATGMNWKDSFGLGVLMNVPGLVELVILNAGLDLGNVAPALFTMMVLMALITTLMTVCQLADLLHCDFILEVVRIEGIQSSLHRFSLGIHEIYQRWFGGTWERYVVSVVIGHPIHFP
jgi:Kef-type K+ transport system membrane component KefB